MEERKSVTTQEGLVDLAKRYKIDLDKMETLAMFINSPSVDSASVRPVVEDGVERTTMTVSYASISLADQIIERDYRHHGCNRR